MLSRLVFHESLAVAYEVSLLSKTQQMLSKLVFYENFKEGSRACSRTTIPSIQEWH
jgi:hypothetical protein